MTQTIALLIDAYRDLNARKLFWFTMILSRLVVACMAAVGTGEKGLKILVWELGIPMINNELISEDLFYKSVFSGLGISTWLTWAATILALISTANIFPELISSGSIELLLSRLIGRLRLFLTKYFTGLLFVALQVLVFATSSFLVIGPRGGVWEPGLFVAVPLVVTFFSYLFCICVLIGLFDTFGNCSDSIDTSSLGSFPREHGRYHTVDATGGGGGEGRSRSGEHGVQTDPR